MHLTKTSITLPDDLLKEAKATTKNFSGLVAEALRDYLHRKKIQKAMESFGSWEKRGETSVDLVDELRKEEGRDYV
jgi:metal-responsive CopG/Arc/MetJ family transcriptional regulator